MSIFLENQKQNFYSENIKDVIGYTSEELEKLPDKLYSLIDEEDYQNVKNLLFDLESNEKQNSTILEYRIRLKRVKRSGLENRLESYVI